MHIKNLFVGVICTVSLFLNGCFDRKEKIAIDHNGNTTINTSITGTTEKYPPLFKLPIDDPWKIIKQEIKKNKEGETEIEIISEMDIPYGEILPDRYDFKDEADQGLRFPSTLKIYKKGNRTFYEFTRRYKSRKHNPYEIYYESIDKELEEKILDVQGIFVEIGLIPNSEFAYNLEKNDRKEIVVNQRNETNVPGILAAGDVTNVPEKQIIIAAGEGAKAVLSAFRYLSTRK